jgi:hypothetical protein
MSSSDCNLITFKAISSFVSELNDTFGSFHHPLKLYHRLLLKTTLSHDKAIKKHIEVFRNFCIGNRECITSKNVNFINTIAEFSPRVYINFKIIFQKADVETSEVIWKHILTISALVDPAGKAKEILKKSNTKEANFLSDIINKVEDNITPGANPMEAVSSIMQSGVFNSLISNMNEGMQDGSLNIGKLMETVQSMCQNFTDTTATSENPELGNIMGMVNNMISNLNVPSNSTSAPGDRTPMPDLSSILPMLSSMGNNTKIDPNTVYVNSKIDPTKVYGEPVDVVPTETKATSIEELTETDITQPVKQSEPLTDLVNKMVFPKPGAH